MIVDNRQFLWPWPFRLRRARPPDNRKLAEDLPARWCRMFCRSDHHGGGASPHGNADGVGIDSKGIAVAQGVRPSGLHAAGIEKYAVRAMAIFDTKVAARTRDRGMHSGHHGVGQHPVGSKPARRGHTANGSAIFVERKTAGGAQLLSLLTSDFENQLHDHVATGPEPVCPPPGKSADAMGAFN